MVVTPCLRGGGDSESTDMVQSHQQPWWKIRKMASCFLRFSSALPPQDIRTVVSSPNGCFQTAPELEVKELLESFRIGTTCSLRVWKDCPLVPPELVTPSCCTTPPRLLSPDISHAEEAWTVARRYPPAKWQPGSRLV